MCGKFLQLFLAAITIDMILGINNGTGDMIIQPIIRNEIAYMKMAINGTTGRVRNVLEDVVHILEQETARISNSSVLAKNSITTTLNRTAHGLGYRFWEINQKIFNNSKLTEEEKPLVVKILHSAAVKADAQLPEPLNKAINLTEILLEEKYNSDHEEILI